MGTAGARGEGHTCKLVVGIAIGVVERAIGLGLLRGPDRRIARKSVVVVPIWHACGGWVRGGPCWRFVSVKEAIYVGELDQLHQYVKVWRWGLDVGAV